MTLGRTILTSFIRRSDFHWLASCLPLSLPSHSPLRFVQPPYPSSPVFSMALAPFTVAGFSGVPFALGVLPPPSSVSAVPIFSGASPPLVVSGPSGSSGTTQLLPPNLLPPVSLGATYTLLAPPQGLSSGSGLSLYLSSEPVPARLLQRMRGGHFVEMHDLLSDNITLTQHFESVANYFPTVLPQSGPTYKRFFPFFMCILLSNVFSSPGAKPDHLGFPGVCQTDCAGGTPPWRVGLVRLRPPFPAASDLSLHWGSLHPSLMASTVLSQHSGTGLFCGLCKGCDHSPSDCAMTFHWHQKHIYSCQHPVRQGPPSRFTQICLSWNDSCCAATPGPCFRLQVCATCGSPHHRAKKCRDTPTDSRLGIPPKEVACPSPRPTPSITLRLFVGSLSYWGLFII